MVGGSCSPDLYQWPWHLIQIHPRPASPISPLIDPLRCPTSSLKPPVLTCLSLSEQHPFPSCSDRDLGVLLFTSFTLARQPFVKFSSKAYQFYLQNFSNVSRLCLHCHYSGICHQTFSPELLLEPPLISYLKLSDDFPGDLNVICPSCLFNALGWVAPLWSQLSTTLVLFWLSGQTNLFLPKDLCICHLGLSLDGLSPPLSMIFSCFSTGCLPRAPSCCCIAPRIICPHIFTQLPWWLSGKESTSQCKRCRFNPWVRKIL